MRAGVRPWVPPVGVLAAALAYSTVATAFDPYTAAMRVATALPCALVAVAAARRRPGRRAAEDRRGAGIPVVPLAVWAVLIVAAAGFQLALFLSHPRPVYPTLSSLASEAFGWPLVRTAAFALWLWLGWYLLER